MNIRNLNNGKIFHYEKQSRRYKSALSLINQPLFILSQVEIYLPIIGFGR